MTSNRRLPFRARYQFAPGNVTPSRRGALASRVLAMVSSPSRTFPDTFHRRSLAEIENAVRELSLKKWQNWLRSCQRRRTRRRTSRWRKTQRVAGSISSFAKAEREHAGGAGIDV